MTTHLPEPATTRLDDLLTDTEVGSVFVSNYPPYSFWNEDDVAAARALLDTPAAPGAVPDLGLYLHVPFCRKRCKFCYFRVYVDKNAAQIRQYLDSMARGSGALLRLAQARRPRAEIRLLRRRHSQLHKRAPPESAGGSPQCCAAVGRRRGNRLRVRAGNPDRGQAGGDPGDRGDPPESRHREHERRHPARERPRPHHPRGVPRAALGRGAGVSHRSTST